MKSTYLALLLVIAGGPLATAEEYPDFIAGMKATGASIGALGKMDQKTGQQAVRAAERVGGIYEMMIPFFRQRGQTDAVKLAEQGKGAAAELASAAFAGDPSRADAAFQSLMGTCKSCHAEHREKLETGKYKIK